MARPDPDQALSCRHFGPCGGCTALDVPIALQLAGKRTALLKTLGPWLGDVELTVPEPPRTPRHDRGQILYPVQPHPWRGLTMGIYRRGTHEVEEITDCRIQHRALTRLGAAAVDLFADLGLAAYQEDTGDGLLRAFRARIVPGTNELLAGVVTTAARFDSAGKVAAGLRLACEELRDDQGRPVKLVGVVHNVNDQPGNALMGRRTAALWGRPFQTDRIADLTFRVSFASFYQQNRYSDAILYRPALEMLGDLAGLRVVDGYGGVGSFGLRLARANAAAVTIVEDAPSAVADAAHNTAANQLSQVRVVDAAFESAEFEPPDVLLVDPPRAGLQEPGAARVRTAAARRVLLVSCALSSLARDLALLERDYQVAAVRLCDLFPHTEHVEVLTLLQRR